jgi:hypothetical protein
MDDAFGRRSGKPTDGGCSRCRASSLIVGALITAGHVVRGSGRRYTDHTGRNRDAHR